ncbi:hypothetical protein ACFRFH_02580 [Leifsonia sp. NPDC056824]|uniref:hypothetical protein n=1 Tax=Leifsonia sp. NPDC056824 TaxID=3345953 RepID=UPI003696C8F9
MTGSPVRALLSRFAGRDAARIADPSSAEAAAARPHDPGRPAEVERGGSHFWASCAACPWEGDDRRIHFDAEADAAQHNDRVHLPQTAGRHGDG